MPTERWRIVEQLFGDAMAQPAATRAGFIERACGIDATLRAEVDGLVTAADQSQEFLSAPAIEVFAREVSRDGWSLRCGDRIASYTIEERIGAGGIGEVWRARDDRLGRDVAIKLLLPHPSDAAERMRAFEREARAAGALNHVNVLTVHDVGNHRGAPYLVTEYLDGESLRARLASGPLPVDAALDVARQIARGLGAAHGRGIVHRDLKPENIVLARDGRVKILDFGLATLLDAAPRPSASPESVANETRPLVAGTVGYMAPEQARSEAVDRRADVFALGAVLYEMLAGRPPFKGRSTLETLNASLTRDPPDLSDVVPATPTMVTDIVRRCLAKRPGDRFATVADLESAIDSAIRARGPSAMVALVASLRRPVVIATLVCSVAAAVVGMWQWQRSRSGALWARTVAAPDIQRLANRGDYAEAFVLAHRALALVPDDPYVRQLWLDVSLPAVITTDPAGADVAFASYRSPTGWFSLGRTPLNRVRVPRTLVRLRISKAGFQPIEGSGSPGAFARFRLDRPDAVPAGMVRVVGGRDPIRFGEVGAVDDFWIDRFEITNRQFKSFVDRAGYVTRDYWRERFVDGGEVVPWEQGVNRFRDATGQPGPATWSGGTYPAGRADFPVGGVSWYEAAAYAAFAGKSLPTMYHWYRAADMGRFADILTVSNFSGKAPAPVGTYGGLGPFGTFDMAGNVKEWCWNEQNGLRLLSGGAWDEPRYMFADYDARAPFVRKPNYGFRLVKYMAPLPTAVTAPVAVETLVGGVLPLRPIGDEIFAAYRRQFAYDRAPVTAVVEATDETALWFKHTVAFDAAYGGERMRAILFLPKTAPLPYQTVIFFPASDAFQLQSSRDMSVAAAEFIVGSGRAFLYPVYKGTYERATGEATGPNGQRDTTIAWSKDLGRAIDYLETRRDIDATRLAYYGISAGADAGVILTAVETRLKASIIQGSGNADRALPELDWVNYAPRIRVPTLMLNGRYDFGAPVETAQRPLFALLGPPLEHKRHAILESGHALPIDDVAREILPWLDRYLGPVMHSSRASTRTP